MLNLDEPGGREAPSPSVKAGVEDTRDFIDLFVDGGRRV